MSPSELSWFQGWLFLFLSFAGGYVLNKFQNRRTSCSCRHDVLRSIRIDNGIDTTPFTDAESSGGDEDARSPSNLSNPAGNAMASTGSLSCPDRNRLRSESLSRPRSLLQMPSTETRQTSHFLEFEGGTEAPNFASSTVADMTPSPVPSLTAGLLRPSGGEDEALAIPWTPCCSGRKRCRFDVCRRNAPFDKTTKRPFKKFMAKDEARNVGRPEPANMIVPDSSSACLAVTVTTLPPESPRHHIVMYEPKPSTTPSGKPILRSKIIPPNEFRHRSTASAAAQRRPFGFDDGNIPTQSAGLDDDDKYYFVKAKVERLAKYAADNPEEVESTSDNKRK